MYGCKASLSNRVVKKTVRFSLVFLFSLVTSKLAWSNTSSIRLRRELQRLEAHYQADDHPAKGKPCDVDKKFSPNVTDAKKDLEESDKMARV